MEEGPAVSGEDSDGDLRMRMGGVKGHLVYASCGLHVLRELKLSSVEGFPAEVKDGESDDGADHQADGVGDGVAHENGAIGVEDGDHGVDVSDKAKLGMGLEGDGIHHVGGEKPH